MRGQRSHGSLLEISRGQQNYFPHLIRTSNQPHKVSSSTTILGLGLLNNMVTVFIFILLFLGNWNGGRGWSVFSIQLKNKTPEILHYFILVSENTAYFPSILSFFIFTCSHLSIKPSLFPQLGLKFLSLPAKTLVHYFNLLSHFWDLTCCCTPSLHWFCYLPFLVLYTGCWAIPKKSLTPTPNKFLVSKLSRAPSTAWHNIYIFSWFSSLFQSLW